MVKFAGLTGPVSNDSEPEDAYAKNRLRTECVDLARFQNFPLNCGRLNWYYRSSRSTKLLLGRLILPKLALER